MNLRFHGILVEMHHGQFLVRNRMFYEYLTRGEIREARQELASYLDDAETDIPKAIRG